MKPFVCDTLGPRYEYRTDFADIMAFNMLSHGNNAGILACRLVSQSMNYELQGTSQPWSQVPHTEDQIQAVHRAFIAWKNP